MSQNKSTSPLNGVLFTYELFWIILILSYFMNGLGDASTVVFWRDAGATIIMLIFNHFYVRQAVFFKTTFPLYKQKTLFIPHFLFLLGIIYFLLHDHSNVVAAFRLALSSSIFEEYTFRGLIFGCLLAGARKNYHGVLKSTIITSILFGSIHFINFFGGNTWITFLQVIQTTALGFLLCALYLRSGSMILPISLHFLLNFMGLLYNHTTTVITSMFLIQNFSLTAFYIFTGSLLLRKKQFKQLYLLKQLKKQQGS